MDASHTVSSFPHLITREDKASGRKIGRVGQIHPPRPRRRWPSGWSGPANRQAKGSRAPFLFSSPWGSCTGLHLQVKRRPLLLRVCFFLLFKDMDDYLNVSRFLPKLNNEILGERNDPYKERLSSLENLVLIMVRLTKPEISF
ncbi:uncharacterized protein LOC125539567 isoform X1 [Triticum urartu]|uniref:uncharacterized protein LOC125539567 isoform X1 n=1 Tax=Triticum urartu TaxID=4572 RepID=UPI0020440709|nr:uncharacterized protein LOC125539567 isoform X1 [Triticum urartu]